MPSGPGDGANVVTALLEADLRDPESNKQFPASLVQLSASPSGRGRLQLSTIISPGQQSQPSGGTYRGTVEIFDGTQVHRVPLVPYLAPRDGPLAAAAFLLLMTGAIIGLAVKWITESLTRLASARWRVEDLRRSLGGRTNSLPLGAAVQLQKIEEGIRRQDTDDNLDKAFAPLLSNVSDLRSFATAIQNAEDEMKRQRDLMYSFDWYSKSLDPLDEDFVESIVRAESTRIERLRALDWPWRDARGTVEEVQRLAEQCSTATLALSDAVADRFTSTAVEVLDLFRKGNFAQAVDLYRQPHPPLDDFPVKPMDVEGTAPERGPRRFFSAVGSRILTPFDSDRPRGLVPWMAQRPRAFAGAASVFVVSLAGLQLQYLDASNFAGELGDWLGLLLWSAVVELSGVSVLDVLGRLGTTNVRSASTSRHGSPAETPDGR
ncbi:MAG TPA: hypothetical protein VLM38_09350 [Blastocatellia bacterium]|nr:hypothetical protein [Blastocatellia bacterium]